MAAKTTLPKRWADLAEAYGGVIAFAAELGVHPSTVWRWGNGARKLPKTVRMALASMAAMKKLPVP
jgi:DNA-binding transcriptional regulator YdaS (Cro superfamily)